MKQPKKVKPDVEGEYVASIIARESITPRLLPNGSFLRLYSLSPNSRYSIFVAFLIIAACALSVFLAQVSKQHYPGDSVILIAGGLLILVALALPLVHARRIKYAIEYGASEVGRVESVESARDTPYSTAE